jgi:ABC-type spermidine/putrescine transport system permease subunit II
MAIKETKIRKQAVAGRTRHITFTIPETLEIIRNNGKATSQSIIKAAYKIGLLNMQGTKKQREILSART